eukprot:TRINITY_DN11306_c0_g1_i1.p1 TRINITY_DN11306_c0_g1~~TRINITY_DN11306_c0_g1_i1.p1  ORF type:complete len:970 (-),score=307.67 TRINITY_DN11306_c0_g1_i1:36-2783(-)
MNQFKAIFLGQVDPKSPSAKWTRAANSQKCIRAGGKHNDLDDVGKDTYHHTFFEMLGNWSFGDYFKEEAISWAYDLLINVYGLNPKRLYASYFGGDEADGLPADEEAKNIWLRYLPADHVLPFGKKENFWEMGDTGPCGPCSELHYDRLADRENAGDLVNADSPDLIEIWNLVFMAYNREQSGKLTTLPNKHIDTGMGFERITSILQDKPSNYDTDVFQPIFENIRSITGAREYTGHVGADDTDGIDTAYRIVADHIRTLTFALSDGAVPSSEGRGYVLRRILRRAVRYGKEFLGAKDGYFHQLVDVVIEKFGHFFPELTTNPERVKTIIRKEEEQFNTTLQRGINKFKQLTKNMKSGDTLSADDTFLLYGTFGFPLDLTQIMCDEKGFLCDTKGFAALLEEQRIEASTAFAAKRGGIVFKLQAAALSQLQSTGATPTNDSSKYIIGESSLSTVQGIWQGTPEDGSFVDSFSESADIGVILNQSSFYAESGGQIYDTGFLEADGLLFLVKEVKVFGGYVAHIGTLKHGELKVGGTVQCSVNYERRRPIMANHTSTHMINFALQKVLPVDVEQRGSIVSEDKFRFDFTSPDALTREQLFKVEQEVTTQIKNELTVYAKEIPLDIANKIHGRRAIFTESYPDPVRVVSVGVDVDDLVANPSNQAWENYSIEFCGGTHLTNTSEASDFVIITEEAISLGERRIVGVTGQAAATAREEGSQFAKQLETLLLTPPEQLNAAVIAYREALAKAQIPAYLKMDIREKLKAVDEQLKKAAKEEFNKKKAGSDNFLQDVVEEVKADPSVSVVVKLLNVGDNNKVLNDTAVSIVTTCKKQLDRDIGVLLFSIDEKKAGSVVIVGNVPAALIQKGLKANVWVNEAAVVVGGKGGGKPTGDVGQGRGPNVAAVQDAIAKGLEYARQF